MSPPHLQWWTLPVLDLFMWEKLRSDTYWTAHVNSSHNKKWHLQIWSQTRTFSPFISFTLPLALLIIIGQTFRISAGGCGLCEQWKVMGLLVSFWLTVLPGLTNAEYNISNSTTFFCLKMEASDSSNTSVNFYQTTWRHNPVNRALHGHDCENVKSHKLHNAYCKSLTNKQGTL